MSSRDLMFELTDLWVDYLADLGTSAQTTATLEGFMNWMTAKLTGNA